MADFETNRHALVEQIRASTGIRDERIFQAFLDVPRHEFVPDPQRQFAYDDRALPIGEGQTISQPSMIAIMLDALAPKATDVALEVGAGSGYAAALLARLTRHVFAVELLPDLAARARAALQRAHIDGVTVIEGDGSDGLPEHAPYDVILVSAAPRELPPALPAALASGGRIAIPVGDDFAQRLLVGRRTDDALQWRESVPCMFVPLRQPTAG